MISMGYYNESMHLIKLIRAVPPLARALLIVGALLMPAPGTNAKMLDEVVAFVDTEAITATELERNFKTSSTLNPEISRTQVLEMMINRLILLREAKRLRLEAETDNKLIEQYIDLKIRTFITISREDLRGEYESVKDEVGGRQFDEVKDVIEKYMVEREVNDRIRQLLEGLRNKAHIKILTPG